MPRFTFGELVGAIIGLVAVGAIAYASIFQNRPEAMTALVGLVGAAASYFLRAKVETPK